MTYSFTGAYGFVIKPDSKTQDRAVSLARRFYPRAEFLVQIPHITLYYAKFSSLPSTKVREILTNLKEYQGSKLALNKFQVYGGKWLFWNVDRSPQIQSMHQLALDSAVYLDQQAVAKAVEEGLSFSQSELANVRQYGHPLVHDQYLPHISLAYDKSNISLPGQDGELLSMTVDQIIFAQMGDYGSVQKVILI